MSARIHPYPLESLEWYVAARPAPRPSAATFRRRRWVAALAALALVVAAVLAAALWTRDALEGVPASAPERAPASVTYTVRPGDTLWSIAATLEHGRDPRDLVALLVEVNGGDALRAGQQLVIPVSGSP